MSRRPIHAAGMAKVTIRIPHISWRNGRPRFEPGRQLRAEGWRGEDLRHGPEVIRRDGRRERQGAWYTVEEAILWSDKRAAEIEARRDEVARAKSARRRVPAHVVGRLSIAMTVGQLFEQWFELNPKFAGKTVVDGRRTIRAAAPATIAFYRQKATALERFDTEIWHAPVDALTDRIVYDLYERLWAAKGLATARAIIATLSVCISWGKKRGKCKLIENPAKGIGIEQAPPRVRALTPTEVRQLIRAADVIGRPEIGDAIMLGVWTGQRQGDRLTLCGGSVQEGRHVFRQSKTGAIVNLKFAPELAVRLAAARARRETWTVTPREIVIDEARRAPFTASHYSHTFMDVRDAAVWGVPAEGYRVERPQLADAKRNRRLQKLAGEAASLPVANPAVPAHWQLPPMPSVSDARDQDLRDTAVTWLARAGCTALEIAQLTGHSLQSIHTILKHYVAAHPEIADNAIDKLIGWYEGQADG